MRKILCIAILIFIIKLPTVVSQSITVDTVTANSYYQKADSLFKISSFDNSKSYFTKAARLYRNTQLWRREIECKNNIVEIFWRTAQLDTALSLANETKNSSIEKLGEGNIEEATAYHNIGVICTFKGNYNKALENFQASLDIKLSLLENKHVKIARTYNSMGIVYLKIYDYDKSLEYFYKSLAIYTKLQGELGLDVAKCYINIGTVYGSMSMYDKALECFFKNVEIFKDKYGENHNSVAASYKNLGTLYSTKEEYDKALSYYIKSMEIYKKTFGESHLRVIRLYNNIGSIYDSKLEYKKALDYYFKALQLFTKLYGEKHITLGDVNYNIALVYSHSNELDKALEYLHKSIDLYHELLGDEHSRQAVNYAEAGNIYLKQAKFDEALVYLLKSLEIRKEVFGEKYDDMAYSYYYIGNLYKEQRKYVLAMNWYQKALCANFYGFNDSLNIMSNPLINNYISYPNLLKVLQKKAAVLEVFASKDSLQNQLPDSLKLSGSAEYLELALQNYQMCDTVIEQTRQQITLKSDKLSLNEVAEKIYESAANVCKTLSQIQETDKVKHKELAFYFSERNKSSVLQSMLAEANALQFEGLPDSLVKKEKTLQIEIALYKQKLAEKPDSVQEALFQSKLFAAGRTYEKLTAMLEADFPEYYNLKHNHTVASVSDIQSALDNKSTLISYFTTDSTIYVFSVSKNDFQLFPIEKPRNFKRMVRVYRSSIISKQDKVYTQWAHKLYEILFPENAIHDKTENLVIVPDGILATIPFEALLTGQIPDYAYLIKEYNISYAYSANLWHRSRVVETNSRASLRNDVSRRNEYDLVAFAPVFSDKKTAGINLRTRSMLAEIDSMSYVTDSVKTRGRMLNGEYITSLPATESEVSQIFNLFKKKHKKAITKTHSFANENFVKSDTLEQTKIIHIATHGFVNEEKPELSGVLLAQDTTFQKFETFGKLKNEDGVLYSGEIYNLNLNADLVVLSACETGLGKIHKGEGVIGLSRALMYAGAENLIVSLWKVADESTSELMVDFYSAVLRKPNSLRKPVRFNEALRQAKLKMIESEEFLHPYYWSPFVLIGN